MKRKIFATSFLIAVIFLALPLREFGIVDGSMWGNQAKYVQTGDMREFDPLQAYGHPGGPLIEGTILFHKFLPLSYDNALLVFLIVFQAIVIASVCLLCYIMRKNTLWWLATLGTLSMNRLYDTTTPPSALAAVLVVLLCIFTLYIIEQERTENRRAYYLALWSVIAGMTIATRVDIGTIMSGACMLTLIGTFERKHIIYMFGGTFLSFALFDPFMWFMPIQHMSDFVFKILFLYNAGQIVSRIPPWTLVEFSTLSIISILLGLSFIALRKKIQPALPMKFALILIGTSVVVYAMLISSRYEAIRYFVPIVFIWETLLPLFIFSLLPYIQFSFIRTEEQQKKAQSITQIISTCILVGYHVVVLSSAFLGSASYLPPLLPYFIRTHLTPWF